MTEAWLQALQGAGLGGQPTVVLSIGSFEDNLTAYLPGYHATLCPLGKEALIAIY